MSDSLIEQVRALAEAQKAIPEGAQLEGTMYGTVDAAYFVQQASAFDFPALLAHLERTQAAVDTAREALWKIAVLRQGCKPPEDGGNEIAWDATGIARAALENLETNDGK